MLGALFKSNKETPVQIKYTIQSELGPYPAIMSQTLSGAYYTDSSLRCVPWYPS